MDTRGYSKYFKAFGDPSRLKILALLSDKSMTVNEITAEMELSQPTVSRHLAILREAGVVTDERRGQQVWYHLNRNTVQNCCEGFCDCLTITIQKPKRKNSK